MVGRLGGVAARSGRPEAPPGVLSLPSPSLYLFEKQFPGLPSICILSGISFLPIKPRQSLVLAKKKSKSFLQVLEGKLFTWDSKTRGKKPAIFTTSVVLFSIFLDEISRHTLFYFLFYCKGRDPFPFSLHLWNFLGDFPNLLEKLH